MSAPDTDMDATKTDSPLQWETLVEDNLYENEIVFSPIYSARIMQTGYPIEMLGWFPLVYFLCSYWSSEEKDPISLFQNLKVKLISDPLHEMTG